MSAKPRLVKTKVTYAGGFTYIEPFLKNEGTSPLAPGHVIVRQKSRDGTVVDLSVFNQTTLAPGETGKLLHQVFGTWESLTAVRYEESGGASYPLDQVLLKPPFSPKGCFLAGSVGLLLFGFLSRC